MIVQLARKSAEYPDLTTGQPYAYPPTLNRVGFFEEFFDQEKDAVTMFWRAVNRQLATVALAA